MANREQRKNREKKKPKQNKDKGKNAPPSSPFSTQPAKAAQSGMPGAKK
jgi:hypothetical protein